LSLLWNIMKKYIFILITIILLSVIIQKAELGNKLFVKAAPKVAATGGTTRKLYFPIFLNKGSSYYSMLSIHNVGSVTASNINTIVKIYGANGKEIYGQFLSIAPNQKQTISANTIPSIPRNFMGSAIVEFTEGDLKAVHTLNRDKSKALMANTGYLEDQAGSPIYIPLIMRNNSGWNTWFAVQNISSSDTTVTINFKKSGIDGTDANYSFNLKANSSKYLFQKSMNSLGAKFVGSAVISSTNSTKLVASIAQEQANQIYGYDHAKTGSQKLIAPLFQYHNSGYSSSLMLLNVGSASIGRNNLKITYTDPTKGSCTETNNKEIAVNGSQIYGLMAFAGPTPAASGGTTTECYKTFYNGNSFVGVATAEILNTPNAKIIGVVNQHNFTAGNGSCYNMFDASSQLSTKSKISFPLVYADNTSKTQGTYWSGFNIYNNSSQDTTLTFSFSDSAVPSVTNATQTIPAGKTGTFLLPGAYPNAAALTVTSTNGASIIGISNITENGVSTDKLATYNGINY